MIRLPHATKFRAAFNVGLKELLEAVGNVSMKVNKKIDGAARNVTKGTEARLKKLEGSIIDSLSKFEGDVDETLRNAAKGINSRVVSGFSTQEAGMKELNDGLAEKIDALAGELQTLRSLKKAQRRLPD